MYNIKIIIQKNHNIIIWWLEYIVQKFEVGKILNEVSSA